MIYDAESEGPRWAGEERDTYGFTMERERERILSPPGQR